MKYLFLFAVIFCVVSSEVTLQQWEDYKETYNKKYESLKEEEFRYNTFVKNLIRIEELNIEAQGKAVHGINKFTDMTWEEFSSQYLNYKPRTQTRYVPVLDVNVSASLPTSIDWRTKNVVTPVKDQGNCGSCWAFSAVGQFESDWALAGNKLTKFSPQQVVDCDSQDGGCNGGDTPTAYEYIMKAGGIESEASYSYTGRNQRCKATSSAFVAQIRDYSFVIPECYSGSCSNQDEGKLQAYIGASGPASICVNANDAWMSYESGTLQSRCSGAANYLDHCVQLIGYNTVSSTNSYWIVRNQWGTDWGIDGIINLKMGSNQCGVADEVTVVHV